MLDLPQDLNDMQAPQSELVCLVDVSETQRTFEPATSLEDALESKVNELCELYADGFQWSDIGNMLNIGFDFLKTFQNISVSEKKEMLITMLHSVIDKTDTPFLPDGYTDPLFKSMIPPIVELVLSAESGLLASLPVLSDEKADHVTFEKYANELKDSFIDGFQWSDIATVIRSSVEFIGGFHNLTFEEKKQSAIDIIGFVIDMTDTPFLPDMFVDPIFKSMVPPIIEMIFSFMK